MDKFCPLLKKPCVEHKCLWYIHLIGNDPQVPGGTIDKFDCAIAFLPILLIENANVTRMGNASVDKVATEIRKMSETPIQIQLPVLPTPKPQLQNGGETDAT